MMFGCRIDLYLQFELYKLHPLRYTINHISHVEMLLF